MALKNISAKITPRGKKLNNAFCLVGFSLSEKRVDVIVPV